MIMASIRLAEVKVVRHDQILDIFFKSAEFVEKLL